MEPIEVTANFDTSGNITPVFVHLKGIKYTVEKIGRQWQNETGLYYLVMIPADKILKIQFNTYELRWYLIPYGSNRNNA